MSTDGDLCGQCGHPSDPHAMVATTGNPQEGGIMLCPVPGCRCYGTWDFGGAPVARVPDAEEVEALRRDIQGVPPLPRG